MRFLSIGPARTLALGVFLIPCVGCWGGVSAHMPRAEAARLALEAALNSWKDGSPPGPIASASPPAYATDTQWKRGQKLDGYEILGEGPSDGAQKFTVRLKLTDPTREEETRYIVMGVDPIGVYREEDFLRDSSMENPPPDPPR